MGQTHSRKALAKAYFLQNPTATIRDAVSALSDISERTIAQARTELAAQNLLPRGRNRKDGSPSAPDAASVEQRFPPPEAAGGDHLLTDQQIRAAASTPGALEDMLDDLDDEATRKKLLREVKKLAFSPDTHPDTRLSATQVWLKLKDMAKSRELGPGKPLTRAAAIERLVALLRAVGAQLAVKAMYQAFNVSEPTNEGEPTANDGEDELSPSGTAEAPGSEAGVRPDEGAAGPSGLALHLPTDENHHQG